MTGKWLSIDCAALDHTDQKTKLPTLIPLFVLCVLLANIFLVLGELERTTCAPLDHTDCRTRPQHRIEGGPFQPQCRGNWREAHTLTIPKGSQQCQVYRHCGTLEDTRRWLAGGPLTRALFWSTALVATISKGRRWLAMFAMFLLLKL